MDEMTKRIVADLESDPHSAMMLQKYRASTLKDVFEQAYRHLWIKLDVKRDRDTVQIRWLSTAESCDNSYDVIGSAMRVAFSSEVGFDSSETLPLKSGDGGLSIQLQQGCTYYFRLIFKHKRIPDETPFIVFQVSVPLSTEAAALIARSLGPSPELKVRHELEQFLNLQDAFDEMCEKAIARIKSKKLSPGEEADQIERFKERAELMKDELKM